MQARSNMRCHMTSCKFEFVMMHHGSFRVTPNTTLRRLTQRQTFIWISCAHVSSENVQLHKRAGVESRTKMGAQEVLEMDAKIRRSLQNTEYESSVLKKLSGGNANWIYAATLVRPLPDGTTEVAVKHGEAYMASMPGQALRLQRCVCFRSPLRLSSCALACQFGN
jgi:acyl-[acyl carrier protein]--UDP-N-acetylglucosamine O-acyltransferase